MGSVGRCAAGVWAGGSRTGGLAAFVAIGSCLALRLFGLHPRVRARCWLRSASGLVAAYCALWASAGAIILFADPEPGCASYPTCWGLVAAIAATAPRAGWPKLSP